MGGQTLNPYGRKKFESGGSSSGSGVSIAANYAMGSLGSETSGSILSPSSLNSIVGLKPTIGLVSRTGIVPISSTLDTSGPMTKNVIDNMIVFNDKNYLYERSKFLDSKNKIEIVKAGKLVSKSSSNWSNDISLELPSTSHISIVDIYGNALSMTTTIENGFGSRLMLI